MEKLNKIMEHLNKHQTEWDQRTVCYPMLCVCVNNGNESLFHYVSK